MFQVGWNTNQIAFCLFRSDCFLYMITIFSPPPFGSEHFCWITFSRHLRLSKNPSSVDLATQQPTIPSKKPQVLMFERSSSLPRNLGPNFCTGKLWKLWKTGELLPFFWKTLKEKNPPNKELWVPKKLGFFFKKMRNGFFGGTATFFTQNKHVKKPSLKVERPNISQKCHGFQSPQIRFLLPWL